MRSDFEGKNLLTLTYAELLRKMVSKITSSPTPMLDARQLICLTSGLSHSELIAQENEPFPAELYGALEGVVARRQAGEPMAYIRGSQEFYGRDFSVSPAVLIPRPETEMLIDATLQLSPLPTSIVDLGTGSGCIIATLLAALPDATGVGVDISEKALAVAQKNCDQLGVADRVTLTCDDFASPLKACFDLIVSNPPYVEEAAQLPICVADYEPPLALFAGADGLKAYRQLAPVIERGLKKDGVALLEIGTGQGAAVQSLMEDAMPTRPVEIFKDLAGHDRLVRIGRCSHP
ncbi:MAG: peptide chain release factor N(5)-glutamine methyltransferase [Pseudomonadota bacterium]